MINPRITYTLAVIVSRYINIDICSAIQNLEPYFSEIESFKVQNGQTTQIHHIIPRCLFMNSKVDVSDLKLDDLDSSESGNLVKLTVDEHIKVHRILWECSRVYKLFAAFNRVLSFNYDFLNSKDKEQFIAIRKMEYVKNMTSDTAMQKKTETKILRSGSAMGFKRTPEVVNKCKETLIKRDGSVNAHRHTKEVRERIASQHDGDADWQLHTEEARLKMAKSKAIPIYKVSPKGEILMEYWGCTDACRKENLPTGTLKAKVRTQSLYRGFYWIRVSKYQEFIKKLTSTTIS